MSVNFPGRPRDRVVRQPRQDQLRPTFSEPAPERRPRRSLSTPFILFYGFAALILAGGALLALPLSSQSGEATPLASAFFTAASAVTVTGHTAVNTTTHWNHFGHAVIFVLMLVGGLSFMAVATFILALLGQQFSLSERLLMRETMGLNQMQGLRTVVRNIVLVVFLIYCIGAAMIFWRIQGLDGMGLGESAWQSMFLSVSAFNNAGFSILPESPAGSGIERMAPMKILLFAMAVLIILGSVGWTSLVDLYRHRRFSRLSLDTRLVIVTSIALWVAGAVALFLAENANPATHAGYGLFEQVFSSIFHSISGRTAGFTVIDFQQTTDFTKLIYPTLMFIGGASGSVAGGIKVQTFAVIMAAVISSVRGREQAEAFGREITQQQVLRALTVGVLGVVFLVLLMPVLTLIEPEVAFLDLLFDTVSAFSTNGSSAGTAPGLSDGGKVILTVAMFVGRLGPITLALALAPRAESVYRYAQERVTIG